MNSKFHFVNDRFFYTYVSHVMGMGFYTNSQCMKNNIILDEYHSEKDNCLIPIIQIFLAKLKYATRYMKLIPTNS